MRALIHFGGGVIIDIVTLLVLVLVLVVIVVLSLLLLVSLSLSLSLFRLLDIISIGFIGKKTLEVSNFEQGDYLALLVC